MFNPHPTMDYVQVTSFTIILLFSTSITLKTCANADIGQPTRKLVKL